MAYRMCPECKTQVKIREVHLGRELNCPVCMTQFMVLDTCPTCGKRVTGARCDCGEVIPLVPVETAIQRSSAIWIVVAVAGGLLLVGAIAFAAVRLS